MCLPDHASGPPASGFALRVVLEGVLTLCAVRRRLWRRLLLVSGDNAPTGGDLSGWSPSPLRGRHDPTLRGSRVGMRLVQNYQWLL